MADRVENSIDALGRSMPAAMTAGDVKKMLSSGKVGAPVPYQSVAPERQNEKKQNEAFSRIINILEKIEPGISAMAQKTEQEVSQGQKVARVVPDSQPVMEGSRQGKNSFGFMGMVNTLLQRMPKKMSPESGNDGGMNDKLIQSSQGIEKDLTNSFKLEKSYNLKKKYTTFDKLAQSGLKKGSIYVHDTHAEALLEELIRRLNGQSGVGTSGGGGSPPVPPTGPATGTGVPPTPSSKGNGLMGVVSGASRVASMISGPMNIAQSMFGDIQNSSDMIFAQQMKQIAFITKGINGSTTELQKEWLDVGKVAVQTGTSLTDFQSRLVTNLRKGVVSRQQEVKLLKTSLNLSTMIGASADETADTFHEWQMNMGLNVNQLSEISRGIQRVGKMTGLAGDQLLAAAKNAEPFLRSLRDAGNLTAKSAENVIQLSAAAQKFGVANEMTGLMDSLGNGANLLMKSSEETKNILFMAAARVGKVNELMNGTLLNTKQGVKDIGAGIKDMVAQFAGVPWEEIDNLTADRKMRLNLVLQQSMGVQLGELQQMLKSVDEGTKSLADKENDITNALKNGNLTAQERLNLEQQMSKLQSGQGMSFLTAFDEASKKAGMTFKDAAASASAAMGTEFDDSLKKMGIAVTDPIDKLKAAAQISADNIKKQGGEDFTGALNAAMKNQDIPGLRSILEQMNTSQQKLDVTEAKGIDPIVKVNQTILEVNETIRNVTSPIQQTLQQILRSTGIIAASLISLTPNLLHGLSALSTVVLGGFKGFGKGIGGLLGRSESAAMGTGTAATTGLAGGLGSPAVAAGSATGASPLSAVGAGLKIPTFDAKGLATNGANLMKSAASMALVAIGLTAVAASILLIAGGISKLTGMSPTEMLKMGATIAGLILGVGVIAAAVRGAAAGLSLLDGITELIPEMLMGAAVLIVLAPALTALSAAILKISSAIMGGFGITAESAAKTALGVASLIASASGIAFAVISATVGLALLGALAGAVGWEAIPVILAGGAVLAVMAPAMELLAAGVIAVSSAILKYIVDPQEAAKSALGVSKLLFSAAAIAAAVLASSAALATLGLLSIPGLIAVPFMILGGSALMSLIPAVELLSAAVVEFSNAVLTYIVDPEKAASAAFGVAKLLLAASAIAFSVVAAAAGLSVLGVFGLVAMALLPFMELGAATLFALTPPMLALASAVVFMSDKLMSVVVDPAKALETAWNVAKLLLAASAIAASVVAAAAGLSALALVGLASIFLIPAMTLGAETLMLLTPAMIGLAAAVIKMTEGIMALTVSPKEATEAADAVAKLMESVSSIAWSVTTMSGKLILLAGLSLLTPFMFIGAAVLLGLTSGLVKLATSLTTLVNATAVLAPRNIEAAVLRLQETSKLIEAVSAALNTMTEKLIPLTANFFSFLGFSSDLDKIINKAGVIIDAVMSLVVFTQVLVRAVKTFRSGDVNRATKIFTDMSKLLGGLADTLSVMGGKLADASKKIGYYTFFTGQFVSSTPKLVNALNDTIGFVSEVLKTVDKFDSQDMTDISQTLTQMGAVLTGIADVMDVMANKLVVLDKHWPFFNSSVDDINKHKEGLVKGFQSVADFVGEIQDKISSLDTTSLKSMSDTTKDMSVFLDGIASVITVMADKLVGLDKHWPFFNSSVSDIAKHKEGLVGGFQSVADFVAEIQDKISVIDSTSIKSVTDTMENIPKFLDGLGNAIQIMSEKLVGLDKHWPFFNSTVSAISGHTAGLVEGFKSIADFITAIQTQTSTLNPDDVKNLAVLMTAIADTFTGLANAFDVFDKNLTPLLDGTFSSGLITKLQKSQDGLQAGIYTLQVFAKNLMDNIRQVAVDPAEIKKVGDTLVAISDVFGKLGESLGVMKEKLVPLTSEDFDDSLIAEIQKSQSQLTTGVSTLAVFAKTITSVISAMFGDSQLRDLQTTGQVLTLIGTVLSNFAAAVEVTRDRLLPLTKAEFDRSIIAKIQSRQKDLEAGLFTLAAFVKDMVVILRSTFNNKDLRDLEVAAWALKHMGMVMSGFADSMKVMQEQLLPLTNAKFDHSLITKIQSVQPQLEAGFYTLSQFVKGMLNVLRSVFLDADLEYLAKSSKTMTNIATVMTGFATAMKVMQEQLLPLTNAKFSQSLIGKMQASQKDLEAGFYTLAQFVRKGILEVLRTTFNNADLKDIVVAANLLTNMAKVMTGVGTSMTVMKEQLLPLVNAPTFGTSDLTKIQNAIPQMSEGIKSVIMFVRNGILEPLRTTFNNKDLVDLPTAARVMTDLAKLIQNVGTSLKVVNDIIVPMTSLTIAPIGSGLGIDKLADFVKNGILAPIQAMGDTAQLSDAVTKVKAVAAMLQELVIVMASLEAVMAQINSGINIDADVDAVNKLMASLSRLRMPAIAAPTASVAPTTAPAGGDAVTALQANRTADASSMRQFAIEGVGGTNRSIQSMLPDSFIARQAELAQRERAKKCFDEWKHPGRSKYSDIRQQVFSGAQCLVRIVACCGNHNRGN